MRVCLSWRPAEGLSSWFFIVTVLKLMAAPPGAFLAEQYPSDPTDCHARKASVLIKTAPFASCLCTPLTPTVDHCSQHHPGYIKNWRKWLKIWGTDFFRYFRFTYIPWHRGNPFCSFQFDLRKFTALTCVFWTYHCSWVDMIIISFSFILVSSYFDLENTTL